MSATCSLCGSRASLKCSRCNSVYYCSKEHQKDDWRNHRTRCCACEVLFSPEHGYYLAASRDIKEGEVILTENPFLIGPAHSARAASCVGCGVGCGGVGVTGLTATPGAVCPRCRWPACSRDCPALTDPSGHALECDTLSKVKGFDGTFPWAVVTPYRCLLLRKSNPSMWKWLLQNAPYAEAKVADKSKRHQIAILLQAIETVIRDTYPSASQGEFSVDVCVKVFAVLDVYALHFQPTSFDGEISALYETAGFLQLSCASNTRCSFVAPASALSKRAPKSGRVVVSAVRNIWKGEVLTYSYTYPLYSTLKRKMELVERNLVCRCPRCLDPREMGSDFGTLRCTSCPGWVLPVDTTNWSACQWRCDRRCGQTLSARQVVDVLLHFTKMYNVVAQDDMLGRMEPASLETLLGTFLTKLHPNHELCFEMRLIVLQSYGNSPSGVGLKRLTDKQLERRAALCREMLAPLFHFGLSLCRAELMVTHILREFVSTKRELLERRYAAGDWSYDRATRNVVKILAVTQRALTIVNSIPTEDNLDIPKRIITDVSCILKWAKENGLDSLAELYP